MGTNVHSVYICIFDGKKKYIEINTYTKFQFESSQTEAK